MTIATIISITGQAWARDASGDLRELRVGDTLQEGEILVTSDNGRVVLDFADGLDPTVIGEGQEIAISADLDAEQPVTAEEASVQDDDLEALLTALDEGEGDLLEGLDATAAGAGGAGGPGGGHDFVRLARISENLDPLAFEYGLNSLGATFETQDQALDEAPDSIPTVATVDLNGNGDVVWEAALSEGSGGGTLNTSGAFQIDTGDDLLALIEVQNVNGTWIAVTADGTEVSGEYGTLSVNTDGSWSYTLTQSADHPVAGESGEADQLQDLFGVRVTDDDGDVSAPATLTIDINDDAPTARDDMASLREDDASDIISGNVLINDTLGADRPEGVTFDAADVSGVQYGTFTDNGDGTWSYQLDNGNSAVQALGEGDSLTETFTYTLTDADGDTSQADLTVTIAGTNDGPVATANTAAVTEDAALSDSGNLITDNDGAGVDSDLDGDAL
ncbi:retention module-containing protein, partial [Halomonas saccharevitans]